MQRLLLLTGLFLGLVACTPQPAENAEEGKSFFDLRSYIDSEVERLQTAKVKVNKSITLNGVTETKQLDDVNFANDLRLFREADINKPAWREKYRAEVQALSGNHVITTYVTQDSNLMVQQLLVEEDQGVPIRIEVERKTGTILSDGVHKLAYLPASGYSVKTQQTNRFGEDVAALIEVKWQ